MTAGCTLAEAAAAAARDDEGGLEDLTSAVVRELSEGVAVEGGAVRASGAGMPCEATK